MCSHCRRLPPAVPTWPTQLDCFSKSRQASPDTKAPCQRDHSWAWTLLHNPQQPRVDSSAWQRQFPSFRPTGSSACCWTMFSTAWTQGWVSGPLMVLTICPLTFFYLNFISLFPVGPVEPFQLHWPLQSVSRAISAGLCLTSELFKCISVELSSLANNH